MEFFSEIVSHSLYDKLQDQLTTLCIFSVHNQHNYQSSSGLVLLTNYSILILHRGIMTENNCHFILQDNYIESFLS